MPIWSLTQERVEKILKQIGDREHEIDELIKLTPKDIWTKDLDDFINEWHAELDEEQKRKKKIAGISRRASAKLGIGIKGGKKTKKRRVGSDSDNSGSDSDFGVGKKKAGPKAVMDRVKPKGASTLMSFFNQPAPAPKPAVPNSVVVEKPKALPSVEDDFMDIDSVPAPKDTEVVAVKKRGRPAATKTKPKTTTKPSDSDGDDEDVFAAVAEEAKLKKTTEAPPSRTARVKKPTKYILSDDDDSNGDDLLGDVSMMVKGIGETSAES